MMDFSKINLYYQISLNSNSAIYYRFDELQYVNLPERKIREYINSKSREMFIIIKSSFLDKF